MNLSILSNPSNRVVRFVSLINLIINSTESKVGVSTCFRETKQRKKAKRRMQTLKVTSLLFAFEECRLISEEVFILLEPLNKRIVIENNTSAINVIAGETKLK